MATQFNFPPLSTRPSSFGVLMRDYTVADGTDSAYSYSRPMTSRVVDGWKLGYTDLVDGDFQLLWDFFKTVAQGTANSFNWTHPLNGKVYEVRFNSMGDPQYTGFGGASDGDPSQATYLWSVDFKLLEV